MTLWLALCSTGLAGSPLHLEVDVLVGMRGGGGALATVEPVKHVEVGGTLTVVTDIYAGAPGWVRDGLDPIHNLRISPQGVVGVNTGRTAVSVALLGSIGAELLTFREAKTVPTVADPIVYGTTELVLVGGASLDLRVIPSEHWGGNLLLYLPLPFTPTGNPDLSRVYAGLGVSYRR